jgi:5'-nucleotidase
LAGEVVDELESALEQPADWPTDVASIREGRPALVPLQPELFWRGQLNRLPAPEELTG